jgi:single-strand DNA-binding protein
MVNVNRVIVTGNLTRDPELRALPSGTSVCELRIACNTRRKVRGEWVEVPNYLNVTVWGAQGENAARYLAKGRPVAIDGRLEWREWEAQDGTKRETVRIVAETVQFLGSGGVSQPDLPFRTASESADDDAPADRQPAAVAADDDDIPF